MKSYSIGNKPPLYAFDPSHNYTGYPGSQYHLVHYIPFVNSTNDIINGNNLTIANYGLLTMDRFGNANSALLLERGHGNIPIGLYLREGGFTLMLWFKLLDRVTWQRLFDFNDYNYNRLWYYQNGDSGAFLLAVQVQGDFIQDFCGDTVLNEWAHLAVTYNPATNELFGYFNGNFGCRITPSTIIDKQTSGFIGGDSMSTDSDVKGVLDEFRYFSNYLSLTDIQNEMGQTKPFVVLNP